MRKNLFRGKETPKEEKAEKRVSPMTYRAGEMAEGMADGGLVGLQRQYPGFEAPNAPCENLGPGVRSLQNYKK